MLAGKVKGAGCGSVFGGSLSPYKGELPPGFVKCVSSCYEASAVDLSTRFECPGQMYACVQQYSRAVLPGRTGNVVPACLLKHRDNDGREWGETLMTLMTLISSTSAFAPTRRQVSAVHPATSRPDQSAGNPFLLRMMDRRVIN